VTDDQEVAANEIARFDLLAIPVLDEDSRLVGIITHDDVLDVVREEAEEDAYRQSAMEPLEFDYLETPLLTIAWKRGVWLLVLAAVAVVTATILKAFDGASKRHDFLVLFLPLVLASGGNTGSQSATLVIRAMALSGSARRERMRMARREFLTGLLLGTGLALFAFAAARGLFGLTIAQGSVVAGTVILVVTMGTVIGALLPLLFDRLGMDPAVMSNPLIASLSDIIGTFIYFSVAILVLEWL
jgi:magnesium transporter